jgi:polyhydroxybutyrate depolymerase
MRRMFAVTALLGVVGVAGFVAPAGAGTKAVRARPSAGCSGAASGVVAGEETVTTTSLGLARSYIRHVPPAHDGEKPVPLILDFHGYLEGSVVHAQHSKLGALGDTEGFVTLTPGGLGSPARWAIDPGSADLTFVGDVLDEAEATLCIDRARVFVTGLSNGAMFTSAIACTYADRVAAVAPVAGVRVVEGCTPERKVPVVAFHGTADPFVAFDGGLGEAALNLPAPDGSGRRIRDLGVDRDAIGGTSVPEVMATWAKRNACATKAREKAIADDVTRVTFRCENGNDVELYRVEGGGHSWPGSEFSRAIEAVVGPTTFSISANEVMWEFFEAHPLRRRAAR